MSIFRKDKVENTETQPNIPTAEEFTDINETARPAEAQPDGGMEEIYSTRDKQIKYKRLTPIEAEAAAKRQAETKKELIRGKLEFASDDAPDIPDVELKAELDADTVVAEEIIEDLQDVRTLRGIYVQDIDDIDVSLDPMENVRAYERRAEDRERYDARRSSPAPEASKGDKITTYVPVYRHESTVDKIFLKAGRFTDVVESEYDEYLKTTDPSISMNYHAMEKQIRPKQSLLYTLSQMAQKHRDESARQKAHEAARKKEEEAAKQEQRVAEAPPEEPEQAEAAAPQVKKHHAAKKPKKPKRPSKVGRFLRITGRMIAQSFVAPAAQGDEEHTDYGSREDEKYVMEQLNAGMKELILNTVLFAALFIAMIVLNIAERSGVFDSANATLYAGLMLTLTLLTGVVGRRRLADGIRPLIRLRGNSDSAAALAYCGCLIQSIAAMFCAPSFVDGTYHLYGYLAAFALLLNTAGRLMMSVRVRRNFRFITSHSPAYAAKIYNDEETARRMVSGTTVSKGVVAYQHVTRFLSDFLKISYAPDPSEEVSGRILPLTTLVSLFVAVTYAIVFGSVPGLISAFAVMLCVGVPFTALLAGNLPMLLFSGKMLSEGAMVAGYPSVRQFCDTSAVMLNAYELFPRGSVRLDELVPLQQYRVEDNLVLAAAVLSEVNSPIAPVLDELVEERGGRLPAVESVMYEDKNGVVGWIGGERVLIGNLSLMNRYHITIPEVRSVKQSRVGSREITYVACGGQAIAMLVLTYTAPKAAAEQLRRAERSGLAFVVSAPDPNVTAELIAQEYELFYRSVKVVAPGYASEIDDATSKVEETSRAYLSTRGRQSALARAVGGCIGLKSNINLGIAIAMFGLVLGLLLCATLVLYASVSRLTILELMIYILFWTVATLAAVLIRRP